MSAVERCGSEQRSRYFPSRFASAFIRVLSMRSSPLGVTRRYRFSPGLVEIFPRSSPRFHHRELVRARDELLELGDQLGAEVRVSGGAVGVVADHEPLG